MREIGVAAIRQHYRFFEASHGRCFADTDAATGLLAHRLGHLRHHARHLGDATGLAERTQEYAGRVRQWVGQHLHGKLGDAVKDGIGVVPAAEKIGAGDLGVAVSGSQ